MSTGYPRSAADTWERKGEHGNAGAIARWIAGRMLAGLGDVPVRLRLWDGTEMARTSGTSLATVAVRDPFTLYRVCLHPELAFGDAYADGRVTVEGDLVGLLEAIYRRLPEVGPVQRHLPGWLTRRKTSHGLGRARRNAAFHYNLGNEFYALWLDPSMCYSCAYFGAPTATLAAAQQAKLDYVCRKLDLKAGEHVVEAGAGWGALALHMARAYGVRVRAYNVSAAQVRYARERAQREGLADRVEFVEDDWRHISGTYDAFVSLGMLEHVGLRQYRELSAVIGRSLAPHGRGMLHSMGRNEPRPMNPWIIRRVFPGGYLPSLREILSVLEPIGMSVLDVENLRLHYARTVEHWLATFERVSDRVASMFDERFVRIWRLYLAGSLADFASGGLQVFQVLFARARTNQIPWTRDRLYRSDP